MRPSSTVSLLVLAFLVAGRALATAADEPKQSPTALKAEYDKGFRLTTEDGSFSLRLAAGIQYRYTYLRYDHAIEGNEENYSNFYLRRARVWLDGHAYDPRLTYYLHLQLEPQGSFNLHDAWLQYKFSDLFALGAGRNKIPYGTEFLASGFSLNFIDRSIMYGESDVNSGGGLSRWPGGNQAFAASAEQANTGFPVGGLSLFRSQGVSATGTKTFRDRSAFQYEAGVWQGRNTKGGSNAADNHLFAVRLGYYPRGWLNWASQGDPENTERLTLGVLVSAYTDRRQHNRDAAGVAVASYATDDSGYNLSVLTRARGFSADLEWGTERFALDRDIAGPTSFAREAWRAAFGYFLVPTRVEIVARYAQVERLKDPTADKVRNSGLGFVRVLRAGSYVDAMEKQLDEITAGLNFYFRAHQHKLFFDVSRLARRFAAYQGVTPDDQSDTRFRAMVQVKL